MDDIKLKTVMRPKESEKYLRKMCSDLKDKLGENPVIVELGSYMGESSLIFSQEFPNATIYCVDAWEGGFDDRDSASHADYNDVESQFDLRLKMMSNVKKIKSYSTDFEIECDMVYIDACHKYECVKNDITHWSKFVKKIFSGHDYYSSDSFLSIHPHVAGVKAAVNELLTEPDLIYEDGSWVKFIQ